MHIKSQINKTTIYFCSRCYGYLTMDVKFKNRKKDLGGVSKLKQQVQRYAFCLHSKWCSEVKGHTCTRLHQEVGRRRQWGGGGGRIAGSRAGRSQFGVPAEDDLQFSAVQFPSVWQSHDALLVPPDTWWVHVLPETTHTYSQRAQGGPWVAQTYRTLQRYLRPL